MNNEEKKEYLKRYYNECERLKVLKEQKEELIQDMVSAKSQVYDDMPHSSRKSDLSDLMVKLEKVLKLIDDRSARCLASKIEIESAILSLENGIECSIIRKRYIQCKSWETICAEIGYSWRQMHRYHSDALEHIQFDMA